MNNREKKEKIFWDRFAKYYDSFINNCALRAGS